jgi:hypothetical protein
MKILIKAKAPFKTIDSKDFKAIEKLFQKIIEKYDVEVEIKNFKINYDDESCRGCRFFNSCGLRIDYNNVRCDEFVA